jgi:glutathione synthase
MKRSVRILALTDHKSHHSQNSIYPLLRAMAEHPRTKEVAVASRAVERNRSFFYEMMPGPVEVQVVDNQFTFSQRESFFGKTGQLRYLSDYDLILFRLPRPVVEGFFSFVCQQYPKPEGVMINHPAGIEQTSNKAFLLEVADLCPPIQLLKSLDDIESFRRLFPVVLKPLEEYGGKGLVRIEQDVVWEGNRQLSFEEFSMSYKKDPHPMLGMQTPDTRHQTQADIRHQTPDTRHQTSGLLLLLTDQLEDEFISL